jgi:tetratricopeptide (TPR) repeat protein
VGDIPGVPRDLAAIVDKAMAREPARRYRDAGELAADLRRFQTGQLVAAHSYGWRERARRTLRRHRAAIAVGVVLFAALVLVTVGAVLNVVAERDRALAARRQAVSARDEASGQRDAAESMIGYILEELRRRLDEVGRLDALDGMGDQVIAYYDALEARGTDVPPAQLAERRARAYGLIAQLAFQRGERERFLEMARKYVDAAERGGRAAQRIQAHLMLGMALAGHEQLAEAEAEDRRALAIGRAAGAVDQEVDALQDLAALELQRGHAAEAVATLALALDLGTNLGPEGALRSLHQQRLFACLESLGNAYVALGRLPAAIAAFRSAHDLAYGAREDEGDAWTWRRLRASIDVDLGQAMISTGDLGQAATYLTSALAGARRLAAHDPGNARWESLVGATLTKLAHVELERGHGGDALPLLQEILAIDEKALDSATGADVAESHRDLWLDHVALADAFQQAGRRSEAALHHRLALAEIRAAAAAAPSNRSLQQELHRAEEGRQDVGR